MTATPSQFERILGGLGAALSSAADGEDAEGTEVLTAVLGPVVDPMVVAAGRVRDAVDRLDAGGELSASALLTLASGIKDLVQVLGQAPALAGDTVPVAGRILGFYLHRHLSRWSPPWVALLELLGILDVPPDASAGDEGSPVPLTLPALRVDRATSLLTDRTRWVESTYAPGKNLDFELLARRLRTLAASLGLDAGVFDVPSCRVGAAFADRQLRVILARTGTFPSSYCELGLGVAPYVAVKAPGLLVSLYATGGLSGTVVETPSLICEIESSPHNAAGVTLALSGSQGPQLRPGLSPEDSITLGRIALKLRHRPDRSTCWFRAAGIDLSSRDEEMTLCLDQRGGVPGLEVAFRTGASRCA